jgi:elongation factor Ts
MADANLVKKLREQTGIGFMECKKALAETGDDLEKAIEYLRKRGYEKAKSKSGRSTNQGTVGAYIHTTGNIGVMVELGARPISWPKMKISRPCSKTSPCRSPP